MRGQPGFFDVEDRLAWLSDLGDQLDAFAKVVAFEMFRPDYEAALGYSDSAKRRPATVRSGAHVQGLGDPGLMYSSEEWRLMGL